MTNHFSRRPQYALLLISLCVLVACEESDTQGTSALNSADTSAADTFSSSDTSATSSDTNPPEDATAATTTDTTSTNPPEDTTTPDTTSPPDPNCPTIETLQPSAVYGVVYDDADSSSSTLYKQTIAEGDAPLEGVDVRLIDSQGATQQAQTCSTGTFAFDALPDGLYVMQVDEVAQYPVNTSANQARRLYQAVSEGRVKVVAFGDSLPAYGPEPWFSERFATQLGALNVEVQEVNVAVPGSESGEWLPDSSYYINRLIPEVADADVIVFSLGGNDLNNFIGDASGVTADVLAAKVDELDPFLRQIEANITTIYTALHAAAPNADIVWILYPNYARSTAWQEMAGEYAALAEYILRTKIMDVRRNMGDVSGLLIMDIFNATANLNLDPLLIDPLHLSEEGHQLFADELFLTLGGIRVEGGAVIDMPERLFGLMAP